MPALPDTQSEPDPRGIAIRGAGVTGLRYPVTIKAPSGRSFTTAATARLTVSLPPSQRGTHMSRFIECLHATAQDITPRTLITLGKTLRSRLKATTSDITLTFPWFIEKKAPVTGLSAYLDYEVTWAVETQPRSHRFLTTVRVPVGTLCPCSKAISDRGAHNQRGYVTLTIDTATPLWPDTLIALIETCASTELYSLLKRPDEKFVTERGYDSPVFVEDLVRAVALKVSTLKGLRSARIEAENLESIHSHNAVAVVELGS